TFVILKFHHYGHGSSCQINYSLNYLPFSAETDGKDPEQWWLHMNPISMSMKIMEPGSHQDTINDYAVSWNFHKIINLSTILLILHVIPY
ncbi:hypothetical protein BDN71DRAFT_1405655, partial [Pleurotus eryngii]